MSLQKSFSPPNQTLISLFVKVVRCREADYNFMSKEQVLVVHRSFGEDSVFINLVCPVMFV
jgi:hypothetical protein